MANQNPEQIARDQIDKMLEAAGWSVQNQNEANLSASKGVAIREWPTESGLKLDYLLVVDGIPCGLIEAKRPEKGQDITTVEEQSEEYKESVLPKSVRARVAVEALGDFGWGKYVGLDGKTVTMKGFGASAPAATLFKKFGFTTENVVAAVKDVL